MNPSIKLLLLLLISLEISFTNRLFVNLILIICLFIVLIFNKLTWHQFCWLMLIPLIPGIAVLITIGGYGAGHDWLTGWSMVSRFYVYVFAGGVMTFTTSPLTLVRSLEQNCHLPSKFAYGTLAALNILPQIKRNVSTIKVAGKMRGLDLHWWSPTLYFKAILSAIRWSDQLAQAMETHGFREERPRTYATLIPLRWVDWAILIISMVVLQILLIALP
ncbi:MAG: energy-coupling factor transporter transmembrane protein EcfT [Limosilactobacillus sp.]|uniref:energy-coupling factor transporter transmembrane component T family protein n=1 Tax=Limosilactobacillus sp. TaxID=2773925 RepID=UPI0025BD5075|nr:energy-coupling factor transporter transmembrane component T [Limosilactobacillus sp.]MCI1974341.1 energy-coupling factor transporter transmembrane protein EcfT [Limosilactobacillus sp.]MCI2030456.1 energy-coupling factor transporter transmembrane protein EcfT [Limosilactobacillus sp.]